MSDIETTLLSVSITQVDVFDAVRKDDDLAKALNDVLVLDYDYDFKKYDILKFVSHVVFGLVSGGLTYFFSYKALITFMITIWAVFGIIILVENKKKK